METAVAVKVVAGARQGGGAAMQAVESMKRNGAFDAPPRGHADYWQSEQSQSIQQQPQSRGWVTASNRRPERLSELVSRGSGAPFRMPLRGTGH